MMSERLCFCLRAVMTRPVARRLASRQAAQNNTAELFVNEKPSAEETASRQRCPASQANNRAWALAEQATRSKPEDEEMLHAAHAAIYFWIIVGKANLSPGATGYHASRKSLRPSLANALSFQKNLVFAKLMKA